MNYRELISSFQEIRQRVRGKGKIRQLVEEGRRFGWNGFSIHPGEEE